MLVLFGSTYMREWKFSKMNINKAHHRSQLTDESQIPLIPLKLDISFIIR